MTGRLLLIVVFATAVGALQAQTPAPDHFDVVSIKRLTDAPNFASMRMLPDGGYTMTAGTFSSLIMLASPVPVREVVGAPDWMKNELYTVTAKAPEGSTRENGRIMMRNLFIDRLKLQAHVEEQERDTFAMVLARRDGRLGPDLKPSALDCRPPAPGAPPPPMPTAFDTGCGISGRGNTMMSGGATLDALARSLGGVAGGLINNRTGLDGLYALTLRFASPRMARTIEPNPDDPPEIFTALQEQLGLKLEKEKTMVPVLVIDHIERPTPD